MRQFALLMLCLLTACVFSHALASDPLPAPAALPPPAAAPLLQPDHAGIQIEGDAVAGYEIRRKSEQGKDAAYVHNYEPLIDSDVMELPSPEKIPEKPKTLSLSESILIALRGNPAVKSAELQRIIDKFNLEVAIQSYGVQWNPLALSANLQNHQAPTWQTGTGIGVTAITGTNVKLTQTNNLLGGTGVTNLQVTQPLMQNFGVEFNRITYDNAVDNEKIARLTFKNNVINVVYSVVNAYRQLVGDYNTLDINKENLKTQEEMTQQDKVQVKVGQMARNDLAEQEANVETIRLSVLQEEEQVRNDYQSFLTALGLTPSTNVIIDRTIVIGNEKVPSRSECIAIALKNNIAYQTAVLQLNQTKRALITAENTRKWSLNVTSGVTLGTQRDAVGEPLTNQGTNPTVGIALSVPFNNIANKQGVVQAKINIETAKLNLEQTKENLIRTVMDQWDTIQNQYQQVLVAESQVQLQQRTLNGYKIKLKYGKTTMFEMNGVINTLLSDQVGLVSAKIGYLNDIETLYQTLATTLDEWNVNLRY